MRLSTPLSTIAAASLAALAALAASGAQAADWSSDTLSYRYAASQSEPGTSDKVGKNIVNFTHVSGDKLGSNLFSIDYLRSDNSDPANGGAAGAQEWYGFYKRTFSLSALSGKKGGYGYFKDLGLTGRVDMGAKNTAFAPAPAKLRLGMSADLPVAAGFWNVGLEVYKETNNNSFAAANKRNVNFDPALAISSAWSLPVGSGTALDGYLDIVGPKGVDGFGNATATEVQLFALLMFDVGAPKSGLKAGFGLHYWGNKFGCDNSNNGTAGAITNTCTSTSPMVQLSYKF